jgi:hypothetical protein
MSPEIRWGTTRRCPAAQQPRNPHARVVCAEPGGCATFVCAVCVSRVPVCFGTADSAACDACAARGHDAPGESSEEPTDAV